MREQKRTIEREIRAAIRAMLTESMGQLRDAKRYAHWGRVTELTSYRLGLLKALSVVDDVNRAHDHDK